MGTWSRFEKEKRMAAEGLKKIYKLKKFHRIRISKEMRTNLVHWLGQLANSVPRVYTGQNNNSEMIQNKQWSKWK